MQTITRIVWGGILLCLAIAARAEEPLTQAQIDQFITFGPSVKKMVRYVAAEFTPSEMDRYEDALVELHPNSAVSELVWRDTQRNLLDEISQAGGYRGFDHYAGIADRIYAIAYCAYWVELKTRIDSGDITKDRIGNLYEYIEDEGSPPDRRRLFEQKLQSMFEERQVNAGDRPVVAANYRAVMDVLGLEY